MRRVRSGPRTGQVAKPGRSRAQAFGVFLLLGALAGTAPLALAHKLQIFAFADGLRIAGSVYFAGGGVARGVQVEVLDEEGARLAVLNPAEDGTFVYLAERPVDHRFVALSPDGHRAQWRVDADEIGPWGLESQGPSSEARGTASIESPPIAQSAPAASLGEPMKTGEGGRLGSAIPISASDSSLHPDLEMAIARAVARQIQPLREELIAAEDRVRLRDILGGVGYILGLTGVALWWQCRGGGRENRR
jgi:nickel transport protein